MPGGLGEGRQGSEYLKDVRRGREMDMVEEKRKGRGEKERGKGEERRRQARKGREDGRTREGRRGGNA